MLPPSSEVSTLISNSLLMNLSLFITFAELALFFVTMLALLPLMLVLKWSCLFRGIGPFVVVEIMCSISLRRICFFGCDKIHDLFECLLYYFFGLCACIKLFIVFFGFDRLDVVGLFILLKCWVFVLLTDFGFTFSFFIREPTT